MELTLFLIGLFLVLLLAVLLVLFFRGKQEKQTKNQAEQKVVLKGFNELISRLHDTSISSAELKKISEQILKEYGKVDKFSIYKEIITSITMHPNTNKNIILNFDKKLSKLNPSLKKEISRAVTDALDSREA